MATDNNNENQLTEQEKAKRNLLNLEIELFHRKNALEAELVLRECEILQEKLDKMAKPEVSPYDSMNTLGELNWMDIELPEREYVFMQPDAYCGTSGFMAAGKTAMLISPGGLGKTFALIQCAVAAATGTKWLGTFQATKPSRVILITAEEDATELGRRIKNIFTSLELHKTPGALELLKRNLIPVPAYGGSKQRFSDKDGNPTPGFTKLKQALHRVDDCRLLILDPASYFMGPECEIDNSAATDWITLLNQLTQTPGKPTVLFAHHTNKGALRPASGDNAAFMDQGAARGASGLVDGVRWVAALQKKKEDIHDTILLKVVKTNYGRAPEQLELFRDHNNGGVLQPVLVTHDTAEKPKPTGVFPAIDFNEKSEKTTIKQINTTANYAPQPIDSYFDFINQRGKK